MLTEWTALFVVSFTILGAVLSVAKGVGRSGQPVDWGQFSSSVLIAVVVALALINFEDIPNPVEVTYVRIAIMYLLIGLGADQGFSHLDRKLGLSQKGGAWAREREIKVLDGYIKFFEDELKRSQDELKDWEETTLPPGMESFKLMFIRGIKREIYRTERQLAEKIRYKQEVMAAPTWSGSEKPITI